MNDEPNILTEFDEMLEWMSGSFKDMLVELVGQVEQKNRQIEALNLCNESMIEEASKQGRIIASLQHDRDHWRECYDAAQIRANQIPREAEQVRKEFNAYKAEMEHLVAGLKEELRLRDNGSKPSIPPQYSREAWVSLIDQLHAMVHLPAYTVVESTPGPATHAADSGTRLGDEHAG